MKKTRRVYVKPRLRTIELAAKEVLVSGCKTMSEMSPLGTLLPCNSNNCQTMGS